MHKRQDIVGVECIGTIYRVIQYIVGERGKGRDIGLRNIVVGIIYYIQDIVEHKI